jgi:hypothetical protein
MRSDAAPAVQKMSSSQFGLGECDNTSVTCPSGVLTANAGALAGTTLNSTVVNSALQNTSSSTFAVGSSTRWVNQSGVVEFDNGGGSAINIIAANINFGTPATGGSATLCAQISEYVTSWYGITFCSSDARLKEDAHSPRFGSSLVGVLRLTARLFHFRAEKGPLHGGFIAQEVQGIFPEAVTVNPDGMLSLETNAIVGRLVSAFQEALMSLVGLVSVLVGVGLYCGTRLRRRVAALEGSTK